MKITQEKLPGSQLGLEIEIPAEKSKAIYEKTVKELQKTSNIPGFRKGKVPRPILLQRLGHQRIKATVLDELIQDSLKSAIEQESINNLGNYRLVTDFEDLINNYQPDNAVTFKATVDIPPEVNLTQYQGFSIKAEEVPYNPQEVEDLLNDRRNRLATLVPIEDRPAQMGDLAVVDFEGRTPPTNEGEEGKIIEGTVAQESQVELSEGKFIPGFIEGIVGMNLGETRTLNLSFPEEYFQKDLAGQPVIFTITLKDLKEKELPDLDDDFAQEASEFQTMAELRESLEKQYREKAENETKENIYIAIIKELIAHNDIDLPNTLIEEEVQNLLMQTANQLQNAGLNINQFFTKEIVEEMRKTARPEATKNIQSMLILEKIAELESLTISEEEITEKSNEIKKSVKEKDLDENKLQKFVKEDLLREKTLAWLKERTQIELVPKGSLSESETEEIEENTDSETVESTDN